MTRRISVLLMSMSLASASMCSVHAQGIVGSVRGGATIEENGTPIPFALVRLTPADSQGAGGREGITNAQGRFQFTLVPVGRYRLQLLRIGYRPVLSAIVEVRAGETNQLELRGSMLGIPLPALLVYGDGACLTGERAASDPYVVALWGDVRKGVEIRRAFDQRYRYTRELTQASETNIPSRPQARRLKADTVVNEPDSVLVREERVRARRAAEGFGKGNSLVLPDEKELLDDAFLRTHCIIPTVLESNGSIGVRFREASPRRDGFGLQGTFWVDSATRLMKRLELEYLNRGTPFSNVAVEYSNVALAGTTLRLPTTGQLSLQPLEAPRGTSVTAKLTFNYWGFEELRPK